MRIVVDKILSPPGHSISRGDLRAILSVVPDSWKDGIEEVRLANGGGCGVFLLVNKLEIRSRGRPKRETVYEIIVNLAKNSAGQVYSPWRTTRSDRAKFEAMAQQFIDL